MGKFSQYWALVAQGFLVVLFMGSSFYCQISFTMEMERNLSKWVEELPRTQASVLECIMEVTLTFFNVQSFISVPYMFFIIGITDIDLAKATMIFPIVRFIAHIVKWYRGNLPAFYAFRSFDAILIASIFIFKERKRNRTPLSRSGIIEDKVRLLQDLKDEVSCMERDSKSESEKSEAVATVHLISKMVSVLTKYSLKHFCHQRLCGKNPIRLLILESSPIREKALECRLFEVPLGTSTPVFTALSYAWDFSEGTTTIFCNEAPLEITMNCARALRRIRDEQAAQENGSTINLWVDAICIDQGNTSEALSERDQQIQIMGTIYKTASGVRAWVGEHGDRSYYICEFFKAVGKALESDLSDDLRWQEAEAVGLEKAHHWKRLGDAFREFFQRSWFTRMWPIQEVTLPLPGRVTLQCGDYTIPFEYIRAGWQILKKIEVLPGSVYLDRSVALQFYLADALALKRKDSSLTSVGKFGNPLISDCTEVSLSNIMRATRFKACSLAKDKFFALLGVFEELEIIHKVDVSRYTEITESELFLAIFESCVENDKNLDVLRLAQSSEGYLSDNDFWAKRLDPYDSFSNSIYGTVADLLPLFRHGVVDNTPEWRTSMPTWVPDWAQWTHSNTDRREIAFLRSYSPRPFSNSLTRLLGRVRDITNLDSLACNPPKMSYIPESSFLQQLPRPNRRERKNTFHCAKGSLKVRAKVVGVVRSIGSVDSPALMWQLLSTQLHFYVWQRWTTAVQPRNTDTIHKEKFFNPVSDAFVAAAIETIRNFVFAYISQISLCLHMLYQGLVIRALCEYFIAGYLVWITQPKVKATICSVFPSATACHGNHIDAVELGLALRIATFSIPILFVEIRFSVIKIKRLSRFLKFNVILRRLGSAIILCCAGLLWEFRISIYNAFYRGFIACNYDDHPKWFVEPFSVLTVTYLISPLLFYFQDDDLILLHRAASLICLFPAGLYLLYHTYLGYLVDVFIIVVSTHAFRCIRGTIIEILGSNMFKRRESFTTGLHFFTTDSMLTGSTSGPVQLFDVVVLVDGASDPMVLRCCGKVFEVVGAAYIGNRSRSWLDDSVDGWKTIIIR